MQPICQTVGCDRPVRPKNGIKGRKPRYCTLHAADRHRSRAFCLRCWNRLGHGTRKRLCRACITERGVIHNECRAFAKQMLRQSRINAGYEPHVGARRRFCDTAAERRFFDAGFVLRDEYVNADTPCKVRCKKCKTLQSVRLGHLNNYVCGGCTKRGRNVKPHLVYLATNEHADAVKVGVTSNLTSRREHLRMSGFDIVRTWAFPDGTTARQVETDVLTWWRTTCQLPWAKDATVLLRNSRGRSAGLTETAPLGRTPMRLTQVYIDAVAAVCALEHAA